ncbi:hypothetical protein PsYK624_067670 [Phanerochaete sordida]|uniref:Uncharacterized protein n=1 Tax=Phanerochaete sordida TaxID=48140 RepID=A0A9P3G984_9APHY|nr:hypothetical protein PsYK624_067670 [Phanerochaete sordida]
MVPRAVAAHAALSFGNGDRLVVPAAHMRWPCAAAPHTALFNNFGTHRRPRLRCVPPRRRSRAAFESRRSATRTSRPSSACMASQRSQHSRTRRIPRPHAAPMRVDDNSEGDDDCRGRTEVRGSQCTHVAVHFAYRSAAMVPILDDLTAFAAAVLLYAPRTPVLERPRHAHALARRAPLHVYFAAHARALVQFAHDVGRSPTPPLYGPRSPSISARTRRASRIPMLCGGAAQHALAGLYISSVADDWRADFADIALAAHLTDFPAYPFAQTCFWVPVAILHKA